MNENIEQRIKKLKQESFETTLKEFETACKIIDLVKDHPKLSEYILIGLLDELHTFHLSLLKMMCPTGDPIDDLRKDWIKGLGDPLSKIYLGQKEIMTLKNREMLRRSVLFYYGKEIENDMEIS